MQGLGTGFIVDFLLSLENQFLYLLHFADMWIFKYIFGPNKLINIVAAGISHLLERTLLFVNIKSEVFPTFET